MNLLHDEMQLLIVCNAMFNFKCIIIKHCFVYCVFNEDADKKRETERFPAIIDTME